MTFRFRKAADQGLWCVLLLPFCLWYFVVKYDPGIQIFLFTMSWCIPLSYFIKEKSTKNHCNHSRRIYTDFLFPLPLSLFFWFYLSYSIYVSYIVLFVAVIYYDYLITNLLKHCPESFTFGEVHIIGQAIVLFLTCCACSLFSVWKELNGFPVITDKPESVICFQVLVLGSLFLIHSLCLFPALRQGINFFIYAAMLSFVMMYIWNITLERNIFSWMLMFCMQDNKRIHLILFWLISTFASIIFVVIINTRSSIKVSTITRKYFHLIITAVYVPGIIYDLDLLRLASTIAFAVFIILEACRVLNVPLFGLITENAFFVFLDEKDSGVLILTHTYLLVGCSSSVWLPGYMFDGKGFHISILSGVISVGIGDTAAALGGVLLGKHYWKDSKKTYEGSICAFMTQLVASLYFLYIGHEFSLLNIMFVIITVLLTSLLEAKTTQVDNLVLPLFMFSFFCWIP